jgi:hypothetical protein
MRPSCSAMMALAVDDADTSRLASSFGRNGHTNLTDAWTKFCTLGRVLLKAFLKVLWDLLFAAKMQQNFVTVML